MAKYEHNLTAFTTFGEKESWTLETHGDGKGSMKTYIVRGHRGEP